MTRQRQFVVKSDRDDRIVFDAKAVAYEAGLRRVSPMVAARQIAQENTDPLTDETLYAQAA